MSSTSVLGKAAYCNDFKYDYHKKQNIISLVNIQILCTVIIITPTPIYRCIFSTPWQQDLGTFSTRTVRFISKPNWVNCTFCENLRIISIDKGNSMNPTDM